MGACCLFLIEREDKALRWNRHRLGIGWQVRKKFKLKLGILV